MVAFVCIIRCDGGGGDSKNDRMDDLFSLMYDMGKRINSLTDSVKEIVENEGDIAKKVGNIETQIAFSWLPWKFNGHGYQGSCGHQVGKDDTTLQECIAFCTKKRQDSGPTWNGLWWDLTKGQCNCNENETGLTEHPDYLHFKV